MTGVPPSGSGHSPEGEAAISVASPAEPSVPNAGDWIDNIDSKSPEQISNVIGAMGPLIDLYSKNVNTAQERFEREYHFLADLMAEYLRLTHYVARKAAMALETASAIEAPEAQSERTEA